MTLQNRFTVVETVNNSWRIYCHKDIDVVFMRVLKGHSMWRGCDWMDDTLMSFEFSNDLILYVWNCLELLMKFKYEESEVFFSLAKNTQS